MLALVDHLKKIYVIRKKFVVPRPRSENIFYDCWYLIIIFLGQLLIINRILPFSTADIVIAWLVVFFVVNQPQKSMIVGCCAALLLETYYVVPLGFYLISFWIFGTLIVLTRQHVSWRTYLPWLWILTLTAVWVNGFELFIVSVRSGLDVIADWQTILEYLARIALTLSSGLWIVATTFFRRLEDCELE